MRQYQRLQVSIPHYSLVHTEAVYFVRFFDNSWWLIRIILNPILKPGSLGHWIGLAQEVQTDSKVMPESFYWCIPLELFDNTMYIQFLLKIL